MLALQLTSNLAYLAGILRDGNFYRKDRIFRLTVSQKNLEFLKRVVQPIIQEIVNKEPSFLRQGNVWYLRIYSKELVGALSKFLTYPLGSKQLDWKTPEIVKQSSNPEIMKNYIRGVFDAEGCLSFWYSTIKNKRYLQHKISITQFSKDNIRCEVLDDLKFMLEKLGIKNCQVIKPSRERMFRLIISSKNEILKFIEIIGSSHPEKQEKIVRFLEVAGIGRNAN